MTDIRLKKKRAEVTAAYREIPVMLKSSADDIRVAGKYAAESSGKFIKKAASPAAREGKNILRNLYYRKKKFQTPVKTSGVSLATAYARLQRRKNTMARYRAQMQALQQQPRQFQAQLKTAPMSQYERDLQLAYQATVNSQNSLNAVNAQHDRIVAARRKLSKQTSLMSAPYILNRFVGIKLMQEDIKLADPNNSIFKTKVPSILAAPNVVGKTGRPSILHTKETGFNINWSDNVFSPENSKRRKARIKW